MEMYNLRRIYEDFYLKECLYSSSSNSISMYTLSSAYTTLLVHK